MTGFSNSQQTFKSSIVLIARVGRMRDKVIGALKEGDEMLINGVRLE